jgi:hypothetical protein
MSASPGAVGFVISSFSLNMFVPLYCYRKWIRLFSKMRGRYIFCSCGATSLSGRRPPRFLGSGITLRHTTLGRTSLKEVSDRRRDLYLITHEIHKRQISIPAAGF